MYQYSITIQIFSKNPSLIETLQKILPMERFYHKVQTYGEISTDLLQNGDIVILDLPLANSIKELRGYCKKNASLILCLTQEQIPVITESTYVSIDDLWIKPFTHAYLSFRFKQILAKIKHEKDYRLSQNCLHTAMNSIPDLVWFKDIRGAHLKVNDAFCNAVGKAKSDIEGRGHYYIWDMKQEEYEKGEYICLESEEIVIQAKKTCLFDEKVKSRHGMRQFKTYKSPLLDDNGKVIGTVGIAHDVTDLENMDAELEIILRSMPFAILLKSNAGYVINTNKKFEEYFNEKKSNMVGKEYAVWKSTALRTLSKIGKYDFEEAIVSNNGTLKILEVQEEAIYDVFQNLVGHICIYRDVTLERTLEEQILYSANTDFLTGLYNRRFFYKYITEHRNKQQTSLMSVDLDNFKKVNDTFGHQVGDNALLTAASLIKEAFPNDLIARTGGDEFLIALLGKHTPQSLEDKAKYLLHSMQQIFKKSKEFQIMSVSIGIASTDDPNLDIDELIKQSDIALYEAKQRGKSQYRVYQQ